MEKYYSKHAQKRCHQRGIPSEVVDCILEYGIYKNTYKNLKLFIRKRDLKFLKKEKPSIFCKYEKQLKNTALVICSETYSIITAMKITKSIRMSN